MYGRPRCREWTPLATQQLRLRNLIQITGHNLQLDNKCSFYYTLHLTSMCAPFYTSEKIENSNPAWCDIDCEFMTKSSSKSIFIRIWKHYSSKKEDVIFLKWGIFFSGLVNIENRSSLQLIENSLVFQMNGGFFTSYPCLLNRNPVKIFVSSVKESSDDRVISDEAVDVLEVRYTSLKFLNAEVRQSYNVEKLLRLQELQHLIKKRSNSAKELREKICLKSPICLENNQDSQAKLLEHRKKIYKELHNSGRLNWFILQQSPQPDPERTLKALKLHKQIESAKFVCRLLNVETDVKRVKLRTLQAKRIAENEANNDKGSDLMNNYHALSKDRERWKKMRHSIQTLYDELNSTKLALHSRQAKLLSEILNIYPITEGSKDVLNILNVPLPDAESLNMNHSGSLSVALGFVAHAVCMVSIILQVPLRYPLIHLGSQSKIIDNITESISENEREFPLHSRSSYPSAALHYGVYLLNKNIAQLRWLLGLVTKDLRATLPNLRGLLQGLSFREKNLGIAQKVISASGSSIALSGSSQPIPTILSKNGNTPINKSSHRISRSVGSYTESQAIGEDHIGNCASEPTLSAKVIEINHNLDTTKKKRPDTISDSSNTN